MSARASVDFQSLNTPQIADTSDDNLSFSSNNQFYAPVGSFRLRASLPLSTDRTAEENNYLAPSYDVSDVNLSFYALSTQPSYPSTSIVNTPTEDTGMLPAS